MIYEVTTTRIIIDKNGNDKQLKESYIVYEVETFAHAENVLYDYLEGSTDLDVIAVKRSKLREIANQRSSDEDKIFIADVADTFIDEESGEEKVNIYKIALYARNYDVAYVNITEHLKQGYNLELVSLKKTNFIDILFV